MVGQAEKYSGIWLFQVSSTEMSSGQHRMGVTLPDQQQGTGLLAYSPGHLLSLIWLCNLTSDLLPHPPVLPSPFQHRRQPFPHPASSCQHKELHSSLSLAFAGLGLLPQAGLQPSSSPPGAHHSFEAAGKPPSANGQAAGPLGIEASLN